MLKQRGLSGIFELLVLGATLLCSYLLLVELVHAELFLFEHGEDLIPLSSVHAQDSDVELFKDLRLVYPSDFSHLP